MDKIDGDILEILEGDGKAKIKAIGKKLSLPMSTVHHRILRMEKDGVVRRYAAIPDYRKIGLPVCAYVFVNVSYEHISSQEAVAAQLRKLPHVLEANIVGGEIDIIAKVRAESVEELGKTVIGRIRNVKGVSKTVTSVVLKELD